MAVGSKMVTRLAERGQDGRGCFCLPMLFVYKEKQDVCSFPPTRPGESEIELISQIIVSSGFNNITFGESSWLREKEN